MINLKALPISNHFINDRQGRKEKIDRIINGNFGQVVLEQWYKDAWRCLTDTGLCAIVNKDKTLIITYYFAPMEMSLMMFKKEGHKMPEAIRNKILKNEKTYRKTYHENYWLGHDRRYC